MLIDDVSDVEWSLRKFCGLDIIAQYFLHDIFENKNIFQILSHHSLLSCCITSIQSWILYNFERFIYAALWNIQLMDVRPVNGRLNG